VSSGSRVLIVSFRYPSHWGKICFLSTPDGENCGLVKNLAITGLVGTDIGENFLDKLLDCGLMWICFCGGPRRLIDRWIGEI